METPHSPISGSEHNSGDHKHGDFDIATKVYSNPLTRISAPRLLIIAGSMLFILLGGTIGSIHGIWLQISLATAICLVLWWAVAWLIRELPISAKSRELDAQLIVAREKAEKANRAKTRFLAVASHEMRTPLNGILGMAKLMDNTRLNPEQANYSNAIKSSGEALFSFVEDMLDITRVETGYFSLNPGSLNVRQELEEVCELLAPRAHDKMLEIACICEPQVPKNIFIDGRRLRQVLINLAGNAIKFTETGGVSLRASTYIGDDSRSFIQFTIADSGPGISDEDKYRIFEEFEQLDIETTRKYGGAGLGLAISKAIISEMCGTLSVSDNNISGVGTMFTVSIPIKENINTPDTLSDLSTELAEKDFLLISKGNMEFPIIAEMITQMNGNVRQVTTIGEACAALEANENQTVIFDELLLEGDNNCLAVFVEKTAVVILLHPSSRRNLKGYRNLGFSSYLIRPVRQDSLLSVLTGKVGFGSPANELPQCTKSKIGFHIPAKNKQVKKILLVEDNAVNSLLARSVLEKNGHEVHLAPNGKVAVAMMQTEAAKKQPFTVIYMDLHMPVMDGLTAIYQIRNHEQQNRLQKARIIALSADEQDQTRIDAANAGADGFLAKPIDPEQLMNDANRKIQTQTSLV